MSEPYVHINFCRYDLVALKRGHCPTCDKKTFFVSLHQDWYGWDSTCLKCGEHWQDGEMSERPFERAWRKRRIEQARASYRKWSGLLKARISTE